MTLLKNKTVFITGASRGIGKEIACRLAQEGANLALCAKTKTPHPKLSGTIDETAEEVEKLGGQALPLVVDVRFEEQIKKAVEKTIETFSSIDILINNASAISLTNTEETSPKSYDLMFDINARGTYFTSQACLPFLKKSNNPHIINLSPPLNMKGVWFEKHLAYTMSKYCMSMCVLGLSHELKPHSIGVNALWPKTIIATAAIKHLGGEKMLQAARKPSIVSDALLEILKKDAKSCSGNFFTDEELLKEKGVENFDSYAVNPKIKPLNDLYIS
ncbi:MAG: short chain dehydrogenase [Zetaproteobacteria bacterium]|nr:short chain dehydrogenase [Pseudobdellovibrionaceae bacterium]|tara:strand:+ start:27 stop:848 length:822 start_codon:yes stop_codon:yes gene_type:complete